MEEALQTHEGLGVRLVILGGPVHLGALAHVQQLEDLAELCGHVLRRRRVHLHGHVGDLLPAEAGAVHGHAAAPTHVHGGRQLLVDAAQGAGEQPAVHQVLVALLVAGGQGRPDAASLQLLQHERQACDLIDVLDVSEHDFGDPARVRQDLLDGQVVEALGGRPQLSQRGVQAQPAELHEAQHAERDVQLADLGDVEGRVRLELARPQVGAVADGEVADGGPGRGVQHDDLRAERLPVGAGAHEHAPQLPVQGARGRRRRRHWRRRQGHRVAEHVTEGGRLHHRRGLPGGSRALEDKRVAAQVEDLEQRHAHIQARGHIVQQVRRLAQRQQGPLQHIPRVAVHLGELLELLEPGEHLLQHNHVPLGDLHRARVAHDEAQRHDHARGPLDAEFQTDPGAELDHEPRVLR
mmetsp:Transcript_36105/g.103972  ORF Transcript_36105/g.103972 Transcript_36105/m.103972 type:complete len:408 (-) Transcript_36105:2019-3242(-)